VIGVFGSDGERSDCMDSVFDVDWVRPGVVGVVAEPGDGGIGDVCMYMTEQSELHRSRKTYIVVIPISRRRSSWRWCETRHILESPVFVSAYMRRATLINPLPQHRTQRSDSPRVRDRSRTQGCVQSVISLFFVRFEPAAGLADSYTEDQ